MVHINKVTEQDTERLNQKLQEKADLTDEQLESMMEDLGVVLEPDYEDMPKNEKKSSEEEDERELTYLEMKQWFASIPVWELDAEIDGIENKVDTDPDPSPKPGAARLRRYWTRGPGAAKIQWGRSGDFYRCVAQLEKYVGTRAKGLCNVYHRSALGGNAPGEGPHVG